MPSYEDYGFPNRPRRHRESATPWALLLGVALVLAGVGVGWYYLREPRRDANDPNAKEREVTPRGDRDAAERERIGVFKAVSPGVANIDTLRIREYYGGQEERQQGTGSGFVWDRDGRIVTNFHVIRDTLGLAPSGEVSIRQGSVIRVTLADRSSWTARLVGIAPDNDLAVVQIDAPTDRLNPLKVGSSSDLEVGQTVYAIGNPFGQSLTFTHGIVSALDREIQSATDRPITGVIQTDASLNPGNSGGPLLDREGRLIGVNTAITTPSGGNVGIGYAIPVDDVNRVVTELIRTGRSAKPSLGVVFLRERDTRSLGIEKGVMVAEVRRKGAAAKAGLLGFRTDPVSGRQLPGDVIVAVDGAATDDLAAMERAMSKTRAGQTVTLRVIRGKDTIDVPVTLEGI